MSAKAITEFSAKTLLSKHLQNSPSLQNKSKFVSVDNCTDWNLVSQQHPWTNSKKLIVKPDQLIKRRGKLGLIKLNTDIEGVKSWVEERVQKEFTIGSTTGLLKQFIVEPFVPHEQDEEFYVCMYGTRTGDAVLFHHEGGVDIGDVDSKAKKLEIGVDDALEVDQIINSLITSVTPSKQG